MAYEHYQTIFDEIYLSVDEVYGRTPKMKLQRQTVNFTDLYKKGAVRDGMMFTMKYDGEIYYAKAVVADNQRDCYLQVLDEKRKPFVDKSTGRIVGIYENPSSAGVDVINRRREKKGIQEVVKTLRGSTYWVNENGISIKELMDKYG